LTFGCSFLLLLSAFSCSEKIEEEQDDDEKPERLPVRGTSPVRFASVSILCPSVVNSFWFLELLWSLDVGAWMFHSAPPASRLQSSHLAPSFLSLPFVEIFSFWILAPGSLHFAHALEISRPPVTPALCRRSPAGLRQSPDQSLQGRGFCLYARRRRR
jgi:hypothetical protein